MTLIDPNAPRRTELAAFLRARRERITPEEAGLPNRGRRRTPGLRREEVAELSGVGVVWYTWLEQGRPINPSAQVLDAIARTLRLDSTEHNHLYRLVESPSAPLSASTYPQPAENQVILDALAPLPATITTTRYDVLAFNEAYAALDPAMALLPDSERNVLWHLFTTDELVQPLVDWEREVSFMVAQLRAEFGHRVNDPHWTEFLRRLSAASPRFAAMWARQEVASPTPRSKSFFTVDGDTVTVTASSFAATSAPDTKLWIYTPDSPATAQLIEDLIDRYRQRGPADMLTTGLRTGGGR
ncbi:helix-turn-helix transcriptional regulator [Streptomyces noboritoensis]|uniref:Helix-turn-helix transcriptional regulator n=1 Tax=Streptomyces noboritoensis TaxID=67337 RepID=A0ABV6TEB0_9ACTN